MGGTGPGCVVPIEDVAHGPTQSAGSGPNCAACNQQLPEHASTGPAHVDAKASQEAVNLLADFQKCHRTEEPDEDISGDSLITGGGNRAFPLRTPMANACVQQMAEIISPVPPAAMSLLNIVSSFLVLERQGVGHEATHHGNKKAKTPCVHDE